MYSPKTDDNRTLFFSVLCLYFVPVFLLRVVFSSMGLI